MSEDTFANSPQEVPTKDLTEVREDYKQEVDSKYQELVASLEQNNENDTIQAEDSSGKMRKDLERIFQDANEISPDSHKLAGRIVFGVEDPLNRPGGGQYFRRVEGSIFDKGIDNPGQELFGTPDLKELFTETEIKQLYIRIVAAAEAAKDNPENGERLLKEYLEGVGVGFVTEMVNRANEKAGNSYEMPQISIAKKIGQGHYAGLFSRFERP